MRGRPEPDDRTDATYRIDVGTVDGASDGPARLIIVGGPYIGRKMVMSKEITIGRSPQAQFSVDDGSMSRLHASIRLDDGNRYVIQDLRSKNGTFVNDERVTTASLRFGDRIQIGTSTFLFTHHNPIDEQLAHQQKMEVLGRIGAGIAHDFNNLLGVISASVGYLASLPKTHTLGDPDVAECWSDIETATVRASELTSRLLGVARQSGHVFRRIAIGELVQEVAELSARTTTRNIDISYHASPNLVVAGDRGRLHQMLMNLVINARDAMPAGGSICLEARAVAPDKLPPDPMLRGKQILVSVTDTGTGMDEETRARAFEPFYTTKSDGKGTGLGLATTLETARYHGGTVFIDSEVGKGTSIKIYLPATDNPSRAAADVEQSRSTYSAGVAGESARILLVDDDAAIRRSIGRLLKSRGHQVHFAHDGQQALEAYRQYRPDVVLLDLDMPVLAGRPAYRKLREIDANAKVLFISGHWDERYDHEYGAEEHGPLGFLRKPCDPAELNQAIRSALHAFPARAMGRL